MVIKTTKNGKEYFQCEACLFFYKDKGLTEKCEQWCNEHHTCNIEITKHAVKVD